jgi:hypothetical protein
MEEDAKSRYLYDHRYNQKIIKADNGLRVARNVHDVLYMFNTVNIQFGAFENYKRSLHSGTINLFVTIDAEAPTGQLGLGCLQHYQAIWPDG